MAYAPLATPDNLTHTPLGNLVRGFAALDQWNLLVRASRAIETQCQRRLAPFTGLVESQRAIEVDPDEAWDIYVPLDPQGTMAISRAQALGATFLVRHCWLHQYPVVWPDLWQGSISQVVIYRAIGGSQTIDGQNLTSQLQYEPDTGHVRFFFGAYIPPGSTLVFTYNGGYNPVPDELIQATILRAAKMALVELDPADREKIDQEALENEIDDLLNDYIADADDF